MMSLHGLRIIALESRRAELVENLVREQGGECFNAPSVREIPLGENAACIGLARDLIADRYQTLVLLTGVGTDYLLDAAETVGSRSDLVAALGRVRTVARGPKPAAVLRRIGVRPTLNVPEPNTWREVAEGMRALPPGRTAIQEYGVSNPELVAALEAQGFETTTVPVYRWTLPLDCELLRTAARRLAAGDCDVLLLLSSVQLAHLLEIAQGLGLRERVLERLRKDVVTASIGPVMTEALEREGLRPDFTPKHPKLAICIRQLADQAPELVARKRRRRD